MSDDKQEHVNSDQRLVQDPDDLHWLVDLSLAPQISRTDARILLLIYNRDADGEDPLQQQEVAEELNLDKPRVSERADHLEELDLLEREKPSGKFGETRLKPV